MHARKKQRVAALLATSEAMVGSLERSTRARQGLLLVTGDVAPLTETSQLLEMA